MWILTKIAKIHFSDITFYLFRIFFIKNSFFFIQTTNSTHKTFFPEIIKIALFIIFLTYLKSSSVFIRRARNLFWSKNHVLFFLTILESKWTQIFNVTITIIIIKKTKNKMKQFFQLELSFRISDYSFKMTLTIH